MELKGKVALITGGAQGIGLTVGEELARQGAHVVLGDINLEGAEKSAESIKSQGGSASAIQLNVVDSEEVQKTFDSIAKEFNAAVMSCVPCTTQRFGDRQAWEGNGGCPFML